jgi:hypothetical protein
MLLGGLGEGGSLADTWFMANGKRVGHVYLDWSGGLSRLATPC